MTGKRTAEDILRSVFGYDQFRPLQREVIENVLQKRDTLAILPTGGGKSLCYQIPALLFPGLTVVISPLIALMKDQVEQLKALGVPALFLNSSLSFQEYVHNMERVRSGEVKLLYVAPETLLTPRLFNLLASLPLDCLTIDEAHCISEWGHDFRPEYRQIAAVRQRFPAAACLALTATATGRVRDDIRQSLLFQQEDEFVASFNRENLLIQVDPKTEPHGQVVDFLRRFPQQSGIVYCFSRRQVDELAELLNRQGIPALPYHAGLEDETRRRNQEAFIRDDVRVMVATIAFGMGINKPDVRFVVHYDLPKSIEGYYQEIGRAGRDGLPAHCLLLYSYADVRKLRYFIDQKEEAERLVAYQHLQALSRFAESSACRRVSLLEYFGEEFHSDNCGMCDNCLRNADGLEEITIPAQKFLSCVKRSGERFGAAHVTHILLGEDDEKVRKYHHEQLSTFGIGKELSLKQWLNLADQLVQKGLLERSSDIYHTLRLTPEAYEALRTRQPVMGYLAADEPRRKKRKAGEIEHDAALFERLRQVRKELADAAQVPPYVIFSDRSLAEMAAYYPQSQASLLQIHGVGQVKLERYGEAFLAVILAYCRPRGVKERLKPVATRGVDAQRPEVEQPAAAKATRPRYIELGEAYNGGESLAALAGRYEVQLSTVVDHLEKYAQEGNALRNGGAFVEMLELEEGQVQAAVQAFEACGLERLRPVYEQLAGQVNYDDLKLIRLYCYSLRKEGGRG